MPTQSLLHYLTLANPELVNMGRKSSGNTSTPAWSSPAEFTKWKDFKFATLKSMYNGVLNTVLQSQQNLPDFSDIPEFPFREIHEEKSLDRFLGRWTQSVITEALKAAQDQDGPLNRSEKIYMASGGQADWIKPSILEDVIKNERSRLNGQPKRETVYYADWAAVKRKRSHTHASKKLPNLLPGDTKTSNKWKSERIPPGRVDVNGKNKALILPMMQIYNYCLASDARYGYLITDHELVVTRISFINTRHSHQSRDEEEISETELPHTDGTTVNQREQDSIEATRQFGLMEYQSIPWSHEGEKELTINLALWWLHILAANENTIGPRYRNLSEEVLHTTPSSSFNDAWEGFSLSSTPPEASPRQTQDNTTDPGRRDLKRQRIDTANTGARKRKGSKMPAQKMS